MVAGAFGSSSTGEDCVCSHPLGPHAVWVSAQRSQGLAQERQMEAFAAETEAWADGIWGVPSPTSLLCCFLEACC